MSDGIELTEVADGVGPHAFLERLDEWMASSPGSDEWQRLESWAELRADLQGIYGTDQSGSLAWASVALRASEIAEELYETPRRPSQQIDFSRQRLRVRVAMIAKYGAAESDPLRDPRHVIDRVIDVVGAAVDTPAEAMAQAMVSRDLDAVSRWHRHLSWIALVVRLLDGGYIDAEYRRTEVGRLLEFDRTARRELLHRPDGRERR